LYTAQKKQQSLCAATLHKPKCLQKSLKLYKWDISVTECDRQKVPETRSSDGKKTPVSETHSCSCCGTRQDISRSQWSAADVGQELTIFSQVLWKLAGKGKVNKSPCVSLDQQTNLLCNNRRAMNVRYTVSSTFYIRLHMFKY